MAPYLLLQEWTREEARAQGPATLAIMPVGATEQHGPHLPVGTDHFAVEHIARAAAAAAALTIPVVVAPTLPFGSSQHHLPFGGTLSLSTETYYKVVYELAESLIIGGFRRIFIVNGHGGNQELIQLVARDLALKHPVHMAAASYWTTAWEAMIAVTTEGPTRMPGHAGMFETALVMALRPELIREPRPHRDLSAPPQLSLHRAYRAESHGSWQSFDGYTDSPDRATGELGTAYLQAIVPAVAAAFVEFYQATQD
jgi:creatinine amidohydrolase